MNFKPADINAFKQKALQWAATFSVACYLDSNNFADKYTKFDTLIAAGVQHDVTATNGNAFNTLRDFKATHKNWITGFLSYDLKNETENLCSANADNIQFPDLYFFVPRHLIIIKGNIIEIESAGAKVIYQEINNFKYATEDIKPVVTIRSRFSKAAYIAAVNKIKEHINRGDIYVTNFCQEFYAEGVKLDAPAIFNGLNAASPNPFSCFFKYYDKYILCASPERFLAKRGSKLISQPIKGTAKKGDNEAADNSIKNQLRNSPKEQQENVMVVDLVRNDLTRCAVPGSVQVEELYGIYSFKHLHQMISTVICSLNAQINTIDAIKSCFPMGSMTGAPKVSAMRLMEHYEQTKRGVYSGAIGYFAPDGDFDFNVVIRSILYSATNKYLSFQAGSAITHQADAEFEYRECLLKVQAILEVLAVPVSSLQP